MRTRLRYVLATLAVCGCGSETPDNVLLTATSDSVVLVEELRIGGLSGEMEYTFGSIEGVARGSDGTLYVADRQGPVIRQYDANGMYLRDVGRPGQGPGEVASVNGLAVLNSGHLVVWDGRNARVSYFDGDGNFERSDPVRQGLGTWRGFIASPEGDVYIQIAPQGGAFETPEGFRADWAIVRHGGELERVAEIPAEDMEGPRYVLAGNGGYYRPFNTATLSTMGPDGSLYTGRNDVYEIERRYPDGTVASIQRNEERIAVTAAEREEWEARSETFALRTPDRRSDYFPIPDVKPFIRELVADSQGRLWVSRYTEAAFMEYSEAERADREERGLTATYNWRDRLRWDVFDEANTFIGSVTLPFKTSLSGAAGDYVWGTQSGDYREEYVVVWRMEWPN